MKTKTMLFATAFLLSVSFNGLNAQTDEQIINEVLFDLFDQEKFDKFKGDTIFMVNEARRVYQIFIDSGFIEIESDFHIPSKIFSEWGKQMKNQEENKMWNEYELNKIDTIFWEDGDISIFKKPVFKLLSRDDANQILAQTKEKQYIYTISQILFDDSGENAMFEISTYNRRRGGFGEPIIIKKIFGRWIIIH